MDRFSASLEYPEIKVTAPDVAFAKRLLVCYASANSELSSVSQYCYNAVIFSKTDPPLSMIMSEIGRVEMTHLNILANLIFQLGYDPKYRIVKNNIPIFWNTQTLDCKKDAVSVLKKAIQSEKTSFKSYIFLARQTKDHFVSRILLRLAVDEKLHTQILSEQLKNRKK